MTQELTPKTSSMKARLMKTANMISNAILGVDIFHFIYDQPAVSYDAHLVTYDYFTYRGEMDPAKTSAPTMKGR